MITPYIHKQFGYTFYGKKLHIATSQELFSSFEVDSGSLLLLQSIVNECPVNDITEALDVGCGTGVLALSLLSHISLQRMDCVDRDALALAFTQHNIKQNGFSNICCFGSLGTSDVVYRDYDLVMSNIPAKAGNAVIEKMIAEFLSICSEKGRVAVVIVEPLSALVENAIAATGSSLLYVKKTHDYSVFHYRANSKKTVAFDMSVYSRGQESFSYKGRSWKLCPVYGLPEFDSLGYGTELLLSSLARLPILGSTLIVHPGQGHIPVVLSIEKGHVIDSLTITDRDLLALRATSLALEEICQQKHLVRHLPGLFALEDQYDSVVLMYDKEAIEDSHVHLVANIARITRPGGICVICAKSSLMHRIGQEARSLFKGLLDSKSKGYRLLGLERRL